MSRILEKANRFSEILWMIITVLTLAFAIYSITTDGWEYGQWFFILPLLALAMYFMRRTFRRHYQKKNAESAIPGQTGK